MSNRSHMMSRGVRHRLAQLGFDAYRKQAMFNRAAPPTNAPDLDTLTIPNDPRELEEMLSDPAKLQKVFSNRETATQFIRNYAGGVMRNQADIMQEVRVEAQRFMAQWLTENQPDAVRRLNLDLAQRVSPTDRMHGDKAKRAGLYNSRAMGASIDGMFETSGDYFKAIWHNTPKDVELQTKLRTLRNAFSSTIPSEGGFLIPETLRSELLRVALENAIVRSRARVIPMESLRVPFPAVDSTSNVSSVYGGIVAYWTEEAAALTASSATFGRVVLDAKKLTAYTEVPSELISDSITSFTAYLDMLFPEALGFYEDDAFISGTGVGEPLGYLNGSAMISVTKEVGQVASTIVWENIVKMYSRMLPSSLGRAVWVASINTFPELATMALTVGTGGSAIWLNNGVEGPPVSILGRPVLFTEKVPPLGTAGDLSFVDFGYYLIGDRQAMSAMSSEHFKFGNDMTAYRIIERVDGRPWLQSAITPKNNGPTLSPFVQIETRS